MAAEYIFGIPQGSAEWLAMKRGVIGSSNAHRLLTPAKRKTYIRDLFAARVLRELPEQGVTEAMEWGIEHEAGARNRFSLETGLEILPCSFVWKDGAKGWIGCSPDGLIGVDAIIEAKAPTSNVHMGYVLANEAPKEYIVQMQHILWVTERDKAHFVSFDPRLRVPLDYLHVEYGRDEELIKKLEDGAAEVVAKVAESLIKYGVSVSE